MKKVIRQALLFTAAVLGLALFSFAMAADVSAQTNPFQGVCQNGGGGSTVCNNTTNDPIAGGDGVIVCVTSILAVIAGIVSVIFIIIGGIKYTTSNGDSAAVSSAKNTIIASLIGLVIAGLARPIVLFIVSKV